MTTTSAPPRPAAACPGWAPDGAPPPGCGKPAGTPWTPVWCPEHDERRREGIDRQLDDILATFSHGGGGGTWS